ncbi:Replication factor A protein 1 [Tieghemiomyces parasiticus]|uniref:Replication protein A subunit n=1 Tax=Tieghemiomyces parasiticus TaxID=78921 RepID=A0A9W8ADC7_9FUNG|nr:Replication factor A protein 1 [Tieghemiomyces parasiticus]
MTSLSQGAIMVIATNNTDSPLYYKPVLQVLALRRAQQQVPSGGAAADRYRLILSDGVHNIQAILATQLTDLVSSNQLQVNTVIRLTSFACNEIRGKSFIMMLGLDVLQQAPGPIGAPVSVYNELGGNQEAAPAAAPAPAPARPPVQSYQQQQPAQTYNSYQPAAPQAAPAGGYAAPPAVICPIRSLNPYQNKWTIRARVVHKSDMRFWNNARGEGKLFSVNLLDESGEIKATAFNEMADTLMNQLQEGKVYYFSNARVNMARAQFNNTKNEYELSLDRGTEVVPCNEPAADVPSVRLDLVGLDKLMDYEKDASVDAIGVLHEVGDLNEFVSKTTQKPLSKRDLTLIDMSQQAVRLTVWGKQAQEFAVEDHAVLAVKGAKVGDFGGRTLSLLSSSTMTVNPDIPEAHRLRGWYDAERHNITPRYYTSAGMSGGMAGGSGGMGGGARRDVRKNLAQVKDENLGNEDKPEYFNVRSTVTYIRAENFAYPACPNEGCQKKVVDNGGSWRCEKCDQSFPAPQYRYIMSVNTCDHVGQIWLQVFNEVAEQMLGKTANEMEELKNTDNLLFKQAFEVPLLKTFVFRCKAKAETYNETRKTRYTVMSAAPLDFVSESKQLIQSIESYA